MMLLDSNIIIYAGKEDGEPLRLFLDANSPAASAISIVEVLGFHKLVEGERRFYESFFNTAKILDVSDPVIQRAVVLRQMRKMSLGDAVIAATALVHGRTLVTRNIADFHWVPGLALIDPLAATGP